MKTKDIEFLATWAADLTIEQMRPLLVELAGYSIDSEMVSLGDLSPYWTHTGDPLIDGQKKWADE